MGFLILGIAAIVVVGLASMSRSGGGIVSRTVPGAAPPAPGHDLPGIAAPDAAAATATEAQVSEILREAAMNPPTPRDLAPPPAPAPPPAHAAPPPSGQYDPTPMGAAPPAPAPTGVDSMRAGYNPDVAHRLAMPLAQHITQRRLRYDHAKVRAFQTAAGLPADGIYGSNTRVALAHYGVRNPPPAVRS